MAEGRNGLRDGKGFHDTTAMDMPAYRQQRLSEFLNMRAQTGLSRPPVL
jgi:3-hydroxybutyryl-CoA dehydrogenase